MVPEVRDLVVAEGGLIERDRSFGWVKEPHEQVREGRLSGPRGPDHAEARARREFERHMTQDETTLVVAEGDVLESDVARGPDERPRIDLLRDIDFFVQDLEEPFHPRHGH